MTLDDALEFIRDCSMDDWNQLVREMHLRVKGYDLECAEILNVGDLAVFEPDSEPDSGKASLKGRIVKIKNGRVTLTIPSDVTGYFHYVTVPASLVQRYRP
jgi:hypothetical protein